MLFYGSHLLCYVNALAGVYRTEHKSNALLVEQLFTNYPSRTVQDC